jgi:hypothetical protein
MVAMYHCSHPHIGSGYTVELVLPARTAHTARLRRLPGNQPFARRASTFRSESAAGQAHRTGGGIAMSEVRAVVSS